MYEKLCANVPVKARLTVHEGVKIMEYFNQPARRDSSLGARRILLLREGHRVKCSGMQNVS